MLCCTEFQNVNTAEQHVCSMIAILIYSSSINTKLMLINLHFRYHICRYFVGFLCAKGNKSKQIHSLKSQQLFLRKWISVFEGTRMNEWFKHSLKRGRLFRSFLAESLCLNEPNERIFRLQLLSLVSEWIEQICWVNNSITHKKMEVFLSFLTKRCFELIWWVNGSMRFYSEWIDILNKLVV